MSDISLTASMRANLSALQSTVSLMGRTQERLSSGKKVNSALDNPTNFFTAQSHTQRANDLLGFKDAISEAIQTIKAADQAVNSITKLIESAKALAEDAKGQVGQSNLTQTLTLGTVTAGSTISIGGVTFTAVTTAASQIAGGTDFAIGSNAAATAMNLAALVNQHDTADATEFSSSVSGSTVTFSSRTATATMLTTSIASTYSGYTESDIGAGSGAEAAAKVSKYAEFVSQINNLKTDAFYKGKNLLGGAASGTNDMTVRFGNTHTLTVASFDGSTTGLGISSTASNSWISEADITTDITNMENALTTLRIKSSDLASNLSIINTRSEWITNIAGTLQTGADNLVNADTNEEGANMLMLQTRQSLSTSALSMAAQSAQSVLKLFG